MTQKELEVIINSDLPSNKKSELIKQLYDIERTDVQAFEKGGKISEEKVESAAEKISRLIEEVIKPAAENGNKTALRLMNIDKNFYTFTEEDVEKGYKGNAGDKGNVYITSRGEYITPGIRYVDGILQFVGDNEPWSEDVELQSIKFPSEEDARFFGENYHNYPELIPTLLNKVYSEDMTLEDILKLDISDSAKEEIINALKNGGTVKFDKISGTIEVPEAVIDYMDEDQIAGRKPFTYKGKKYYLNGDKQGIPAEHLEKHSEDKERQIGHHEQGEEIPKDLQGALITITISTEEPKEEVKEEFNASPMTINIGGKAYDVRIADTELSRRIGLSKETELPEDEGMLFIFEDPSTAPFTMADTKIDLDIIFIDEDGKVIEVHSVKAGDEKPVKCSKEYVYVLEVNYGSEIEEGDELEVESDDFTEEEKLQVSRSKMLVLDENGDVQMKLQGGERIVSIRSTKRLLKLALKAYKNETDSDYRRVGRFIMKEFIKQDRMEPQYVEAPEKKGEKDGE